MNEIYPIINTPTNAVTIKKPSFKSSGYQIAPSDYDTFVKEQEKAKKSAKRKENIYYSFLGIMAMASLATLGVMAHQYGMFKRFKLDFKDLSKEKALSEMALPESQKRAAERISNRIENYDEIIAKGGKTGSSILFYGPPGTGKNTFAYGIAKKFPNAKFVDLDISKMNSKWHGESEQNVLGTMNAIIKYAGKNPKEKVFVFIDEIDSVMMQDRSGGAKLSNDILNAFKKGFNQLTNKENIVVMGATNLRLDPKKAMLEGKVLDSAMVDRFAQKVLVDLPTKSQIKEGAKIFYNNPKHTMVDDALKNVDDPRWEKIADFLSKEERQTSFRKLTDILGSAAENAKIGKKVDFDDVVKAIVDNQNSLYATDAEIQAFLKSIK